MRFFAVALFALAAAPAFADEFDSNGVRIHYTVQGEGEPVVLIHGLDSSGAINWERPGIVKRLTAKKWRVILPDARGHGRSEKPKEEGAYGTEMVEDVVRLLDHLKIDQAHLVGYSMGGMIALKCAVLHPDRVKSVVLGGMGWLKAGSPLEAIWERALSRQRLRTPAACARSLGALSLTEEEVKGVKLPVSVLVGDRDPCRKLYVEPLSRVRPDWPVTIVEGAGHLNCIMKESFGAGLVKAIDGAAAMIPGEPR